MAVPESVQSCFELSIHLTVKRTSRELLLKIVRGKNTGKCMDVAAGISVIRRVS